MTVVTEHVPPDPASPATPDVPAREQLPLATQLTRFVLVGGLSALVDFGLLLAGQYWLGWHHNLAKAVSFVFGTLTAYSINRSWTFRADHSHRRLAAVVVLYLLTFVLQVGTFALLFVPLAGHFGQGVANLAGFVVAHGLATTVNFIVQRAVIFRHA